MTSRLLAINRGKTGPNQSFSLVRPADPSASDLLLGALGSDSNEQRRQQLFGDPTYVFQFAYPWDDVVGLVTRPRITPTGAGPDTVIGHWSDAIGEPSPIRLSIDSYQGFFTTLVRRGDAEALGLAMHPTAPDTIAGPPPADAVGPRRGHEPEPVEASLARLHFDMPEEPTPADHPVIVALPCALPVGPGQTFPHPLLIRGDETFRDSFLLFEVYRAGLRYALDHNGGLSVTLGGPLFHQPGLALPAGVDDPFSDFDLQADVTVEPTQLPPNHGLHAAARTSFMNWSDTMWAEIGGSMGPEAPPGPLPGGGPNFSPEAFRDALDPVINREKKFRLAERTSAKYRILLAGSPAADAADANVVSLPDLKEPFVDYLGQATSATAADDLKELYRSALVVFQASGASTDRDITLEPDNITLAFSDRVRTYTWLMEKLITTSPAGARVALNLIHTLTPDRDSLAVVSESDQGAVTLVMSNSASGTAQLDASKASKLYYEGSLETFRDAHISFLNLRAVLSLMIEDLGRPLVLQKMMEYSELLVGRDGRLFFLAHKNVPHLAIHPWQDLQTIWTSFVRVGANSTLYTAVIAGGTVDVSNYSSAVALADTLIRDLRAILHGNGLGKFHGTPICSTWFGKSVTPPVAPLRGGGKEPKAAKDVNPASSKRQKPDPAEVERKKTLGVFRFDPVVAGTAKLPVCEVRKKKRGSKTAERLCMKFLTQGHYCPNPNCPSPHESNIGSLPVSDRAKLLELVKNSSGLSWVEGKAPPGTD